MVGSIGTSGSGIVALPFPGALGPEAGLVFQLSKTLSFVLEGYTMLSLPFPGPLIPGKVTLQQLLLSGLVGKLVWSF